MENTSNNAALEVMFQHFIEFVRLFQALSVFVSSFLYFFQVIPMLTFVRRFLDENPLIACSDEVQYIKTKLLADTDQLKVKQKAGILDIRAIQDK